MESLIDLQRLTGDYLWDLGVNIIVALMILVLGRLTANAISGLTRRILQRSGLEEILVNFSTTITNALLTLVVIIAAVDRLGVDTTSLIALLGAAGIAVGLALKDSLGNFAAGIMLIVSRPFRTGDYIEVAGSAGSVENISLFTTTLLTPDNREITVPNGAIYADTITNWSARDTRRIDLVIGISYEDNLTTAKYVIETVLAAEERILEESPPLVGVLELADNSVNLTVRAWTKATDYFATKLALTENIKLAFDEANITIPYPQIQVHTKNSKLADSDRLG
jgi:small conductance mechanosensitive channel